MASLQCYSKPWRAWCSLQHQIAIVLCLCNYANSNYSCTPLLLACHYGDPASVKHIVESWRVDVNHATIYYFDPAFNQNNSPFSTRSIKLLHCLSQLRQATPKLSVTSSTKEQTSPPKHLTKPRFFIMARLLSVLSTVGIVTFCKTREEMFRCPFSIGIRR